MQKQIRRESIRFITVIFFKKINYENNILKIVTFFFSLCLQKPAVNTK